VSRLFWPLSIPCGTFSSLSTFFCTVPCPLHLSHGCSISWSVPTHVGHVRCVCTLPNGVFCSTETLPAPEHVLHVDFDVPGLVPSPSQTSQTTSFLIVTVLVAPKTASSKVTVIVYWRSSPFLGAFGSLWPPPPKNELKISSKPPKPPAPPNPPPPPKPPWEFIPSCPKRSYCARLLSSDSTSYASDTSLNFSSDPSFMSG